MIEVDTMDFGWCGALFARTRLPVAISRVHSCKTTYPEHQQPTTSTNQRRVEEQRDAGGEHQTRGHLDHGTPQTQGHWQHYTVPFGRFPWGYIATITGECHLDAGPGIGRARAQMYRLARDAPDGLRP